MASILAGLDAIGDDLELLVDELGAAERCLSGLEDLLGVLSLLLGVGRHDVDGDVGQEGIGSFESTRMLTYGLSGTGNERARVEEEKQTYKEG